MCDEVDIYRKIVHNKADEGRCYIWGGSRCLSELDIGFPVRIGAVAVMLVHPDVVDDILLESTWFNSCDSIDDVTEGLEAASLGALQERGFGVGRFRHVDWFNGDTRNRVWESWRHRSHVTLTLMVWCVSRTPGEIWKQRVTSVTVIAMTSSNGNIFCVIGPLWGGTTRHRWRFESPLRSLWRHCYAISIITGIIEDVRNGTRSRYLRQGWVIASTVFCCPNPTLRQSHIPQCTTL